MNAATALRPTVPDTLRADPQLRELLLSYFLETYTGVELAVWPSVP